MTKETKSGCYGVCCPHHASCPHYAAVDGAPADLRIIGTCDPSRTTWPLFVAIKESA